MQNFQFIFGLAFSIPVAILAPFVTKWVEAWRAKRSVKQAEIRRNQIQTDIAMIRSYREDRGLFSSYLIGKVLVLTVASAVGTLGSTFFYSFGQFTGSYQMATLAGNVIVILVMTYVIQVGMQTLRIRRKVMNFQSVLASAEEELARLQAMPSVQAQELRRIVAVP